METSHNPIKLAQHNRNKSQHTEISTTQLLQDTKNKISTTQWKQLTTQ